MRSLHLAALLALMLTFAGTACTRGGEPDRTPPDVPVQGGEALQVEVDPQNATVGADTPTVGTPGVTRPSRDTL
ncbi:MAG TPA: hypothetical protein VGR27_07980 [Longimicrobiaceae bacterium]|nr:hypothetical protein [Longimicrobiaceae bacterium]